MKARVYLDIDGVILAQRHPAPEACRTEPHHRDDGSAVEAVWNQQVVACLRDLVEHVEVVIASMWQSEAPALLEQLGLPQWRYLDLGHPPGARVPGGTPRTKAKALRRDIEAAPPATFVWIDDEHEIPGTITIAGVNGLRWATNPATGLTLAGLDAIERWIGGRS